MRTVQEITKRLLQFGAEQSGTVIQYIEMKMRLLSVKWVSFLDSGSWMHHVSCFIDRVGLLDVADAHFLSVLHVRSWEGVIMCHLL